MPIFLGTSPPPASTASSSILTLDVCQVMQEKCNTIERENSELASSLKTTQGTKTQIVERARRDEGSLREAEQSLVDAQSLAQEARRALENEKRASALLQTEMVHLKELLGIEKKRRAESDQRQQRSDDQAAACSIQAHKLEEEIAVLTQSLRQRDAEGLMQSERVEHSNAQVEEIKGVVGQLQYDLDAIRQEKTKWLDERLELRRAVTELEYSTQVGVDSRELKYRTARNPWVDGRNPQDKAGANAATLAQRIFETATQIKNMRQEYAEAVSTNQELDNKYVGLVKTNDFFRHRIEDVESLVSCLVSELCELSGEMEDTLQDTDRIQSLQHSQSVRDSVKIANMEHRSAQQETKLKENAEVIKISTRARDEAHASLERCDQLRASAEEIVRGTDGKSKKLENSLEKAEDANRRATTESDLLRRTINELEGQYKGLQTQAKHSTDQIADELRSNKKEVLRLQAELSQAKTLQMASFSDAESKEAARLMAVKARDETGRRLKEIKAEVENLDVELRGAEKERDTGIAKLEELAHRIQEMEQNKRVLSEQMNRTMEQFVSSEKTTGILQGELKSLGALYDKVVVEHSEGKKQLAEMHSDLIEMRRLLRSNEAEIENLQTINESVYSEKSNASEEVARLSQQYRDSKQQEAHLIAELAESRLERNSLTREMSATEQLLAQLTADLSSSRQQHAAAALHASEMRTQLVQLQKEAEEVQQQLFQTVAELDSLRKRFADVLRQNTDLEDRSKALNDRQNVYAQGEADQLRRIQVLDESVDKLHRDLEESRTDVASLTHANSDLGQRNRSLESELDEQLAKLHEAVTNNTHAMDSIFARDSVLIVLKDQVQSVEFQKSCLAGDLETSQQKFVGDLEISQQKVDHESKARKEAEDISAMRAQQIDSLKEAIAKVGEEGRNRCLSLDEMWQGKHSALEVKLQETSAARAASEQLARETAEQVATFANSNRTIAEELQTTKKELHATALQKQTLQESLDKTRGGAVEMQKELEGSLHMTKEALDVEQNKHRQATTDLQKVTKQRERLREEFITLSSKYKSLMNETDKLANSLDHHSQNRLAQTTRAGDVYNQGMENARIEFEDDMLRMALDLKDLMHNQFTQNLESPGSDNLQFTPERRSLYKSVAASVVDPKEEIRAIAAIGIAKDRIQVLEDRDVERENELVQSTNTLAQSHARQSEAEAALLASRQRQDSLEQEIQVLTASQRQMHSETIKLRSEYGQTKILLDSRNQELEIQKQTAVNMMHELKSEQSKVLSAVQRDAKISEEMIGMKQDYHDAMEAYRVSEMLWTKKVLEAETNLAESVDTAKLHLDSYRALESAKKHTEATLTSKLHDTNKAYDDIGHKYEISKAAWDEEMEGLDRKCRYALQENKQLQEQNEEARLAHMGLIVQLEEHETELSAAKVKNKKFADANTRLEDQTKVDEETIQGLRDDVERNEQQNLELEETLDKVQESCRHQALSMAELDEEVVRLKTSSEDGASNMEGMTSAYQDLTNRFNLCLKREMDAVTKIDMLESLSEQLQSKIVASETNNFELHSILSQQTSLLVACSNDLETTQVKVEALREAIAKQSSYFVALQFDCTANKASLQDKALEVHSLKDRHEQSMTRIRKLEVENDALQGDVFENSSHIDTLEGRSMSLHEILVRHEADKLKLQKKLRELQNELRELQNELRECKLHQIAETSLVDEYVTKNEKTIADLEEQCSHLPALRSTVVEYEEKLCLYCKMEEDYAVLQRDHAILNSSINIVSHQHQTVKSRLAVSEASVRETNSQLDRNNEELLAVQRQLLKSEEENEQLHWKVESSQAKNQEYQDKLAHVNADNMAMQKYLVLLEEQVQSLNGCIVKHEKDEEDLRMDIIELKNAQDSDRIVIDSLRLELSQMRSELLERDAGSQELTVQCKDYAHDIIELKNAQDSDRIVIESFRLESSQIRSEFLQRDADFQELTVQCHGYAKDSDQIWSAVELAVASIQIVSELFDAVFTAALNHGQHANRIADHMELALAIVQPTIDEVTYRTADISMLRDGHRAWLKAEDNLENAMATNVQLRKKIEVLQQNNQADISQRHRESLQVEQSVSDLEERTANVSATLLSIFQRHENSNAFLGGALEVVEQILEAFSPLMGRAHSEQGSLVHRIDRLVLELAQSQDKASELHRHNNLIQENLQEEQEARSSTNMALVEATHRVNELQGAAAQFEDKAIEMQRHNAMIQENLREEQKARSSTNMALAHATHRVNELQGAVQDFQKDLMGKQRLIAYLEEQQSSLHGSLTAHQVNLKEKEKHMQHMDVSWLQDKNQLMHKESELESLRWNLEKARQVFHENREYNMVVTDMIVGLEHDVLRVCAMVEDSALLGNEFVSLRGDRKKLLVTQGLLVQEESKVTVFNEVLTTLQENHQNLESAQTETIAELESVSKQADLLKDTVHKQHAEINFLTKKTVFGSEQADFYATEVEAKIRLLDSGLTQVTEMVTIACQQVQDLPELRGARKIVHKLEHLLRSIEKSLSIERAYSRDEGCEVERMESCIHELKTLLADKSLAAEKLDTQVQQLSPVVSTLEHDLRELQTVIDFRSNCTIQVQECLMRAELTVDSISSTVTQAKYSTDNYCDVLQKCCKDALVPQTGADSPMILKDLVAKMVRMQNGIRELQDTNVKLSNSLAEAASINAEYKQMSAEYQVRIENLSSELSSKQQLVSVLQGQSETLQCLAMTNATEKGKLQESVGTMQLLQARLAQTETELDRFQKSHVTLQAENTQRLCESLQMQSSITNMDKTLDLLSNIVVKSLEQEEGNGMSLGSAVGVLEYQLDQLSPSMYQVQSQNWAMLSETNRVVAELQLSCHEVQRLRDSLAMVESRLKQEKIENSSTKISLADGRHMVNELQGTLQEMHADMLGKQRYIAYLEEQQTSLHSSIFEQHMNKTATEKELQEEKSEIHVIKDKFVHVSAQLSSSENNLELLQADVQTRDVTVLLQQENIESLEWALKECTMNRDEANSAHVAIAAEMEAAIRQLEALVFGLRNTSEAFSDTLHAEQATNTALRSEVKNERMSAADFEKELIGQQQLVGLLQKQVESLHVQMLHQEAGKIEIEKEAFHAIALKHELHIAAIKLDEQKQTLDEYRQQIPKLQQDLSQAVNLKHDLHFAAIKIDDQKHSLDEYHRQNAAMHEDISQAVALKHELHIAAIKIDDQKQSLDEYHQQKAAMQKDLSAMQEDLSDKEKHIAVLEEQVKSVQASWKRLEQEKECLEARLHVLDSSLSDSKDRNRYLSDSLMHVQSSLKQQQQADVHFGFLVDGFHKGMDDLTNNLQRSDSYAKTSRSQQDCFEKDLAEQGRLYQALADGVLSSVVSLESCVDDALRDSRRVRHEMLKYMADNVDLRERLCHVEAELHEEKGTAVRQLETSLTEQESKNALVMHLQSENQSNQKLFPILENQIHSLHKTIVQRETENERLASQIAQLETQNSDQFVEISMLKSRLNECAALIALSAKHKANAESLEGMLQLASSKIEQLEAVILQSDTAVMALRDELQESRDKLHLAQTLLGDWQGKVQGFESETVSASKIIAHLHQQVHMLQKEYAELVTHKDALEARVHVMHDIRTEGEMQLEKIKHGLVLDREEMASLHVRNKQVESQLQEMQQVDESKNRLIDLMETAAETSLQQLDDMQTELDAVKSEYEAEQQLSSMLQTQVQTLHAVVLQHETLKQM